MSVQSGDMDQLSALLTPGTSSTPSCRGRKDQDYFELMNKYFKVYNEVHFVYLTIFIFNLIVGGLAMVQDDYGHYSSCPVFFLPFYLPP